MLDSLSSQRVSLPSSSHFSVQTKTLLARRSVWVATLGLSLLGLSACESLPASPQANPSATPGMVSSPNAESTANASSALPSSTQVVTSSPQTQTSQTVVIIPIPVLTEPATQTVPTVSEPTSVSQHNPLTQTPSYDEGYSSADKHFGIPEIINPPKMPTYEPPSLPPVPVINTPTQPSQSAREALLERARQNSQAGFETQASSAGNGDNLPAFRQLMNSGIADLKANRLTAAESKFTRAQRLAPRSSAVYFYLSQVALKKNQPKKAEAMARRGLVVAEDTTRRRALWQLILRSGQMQNNARVVSEASKALR